MNNFETLNVLNCLDASIRKKLERKKKDVYFSGKRMEGYEEAMLAVLSMIHSEKKKLKQRK